MEIDEKIRIVDKRITELRDASVKLKIKKSRAYTDNKKREHDIGIKNISDLLKSNEKMLVMLYNFKETGSDLFH